MYGTFAFSSLYLSLSASVILSLFLLFTHPSNTTLPLSALGLTKVVINFPPPPTSKP